MGTDLQTSAGRQAHRRADASIGPYTGGVAGQRGKLPDAGRPPAVPGPTARLPCIVGRAFTPAGEVCGNLEGYWQGKAPHPSVGWRRQLPLQGSLSGGSFPKASPARGCEVERRLRRRKLFLMQQTAVTPFIIACSAIESIGPPYLRPKSRACGPVGLRNSACGR